MNDNETATYQMQDKWWFGNSSPHTVSCKCKTYISWYWKRTTFLKKLCMNFFDSGWECGNINNWVLRRVK